MTTSSSVSGLPLPENNDLLNAQATFGGYASAADNLLVPRFATTTDRNTAFAGGVSAGQMCSITNSGTFGEPMIFDGSNWVYVPAPIYNFTTTTQNFTNTTLTNVTNLSVSLRANAIYELRLGIFATNSVSNVGLKVDMTMPAGGAVYRSILGSQIAASSASGAYVLGLPNTTASAVGVAPGGAGFSQHIQETGIITTSSTSGTLQVRAAQANANASATVIAANSFIIATRIG